LAPGGADRAPCPECSQGPAGIAGHDRLFSHTMSAVAMHFKCRACELAWARTQASDGVYRWEAITSPSGADVPGRPGTAPP
jgi:hypothetical protein